MTPRKAAHWLYCELGFCGDDPNCFNGAPRHVQNEWVAKVGQLLAIADRNPQGGDAQQAPSQRDESGGAEGNRTDTGNQREAA